jgi:hypothetical protein
MTENDKGASMSTLTHSESTGSSQLTAPLQDVAAMEHKLLRLVVTLLLAVAYGTLMACWGPPWIAWAILAIVGTFAAMMVWSREVPESEAFGWTCS